MTIVTSHSPQKHRRLTLVGSRHYNNCNKNYLGHINEVETGVLSEIEAKASNSNGMDDKEVVVDSSVTKGGSDVEGEDISFLGIHVGAGLRVLRASISSYKGSIAAIPSPYGVGATFAARKIEMVMRMLERVIKIILCEGKQQKKNR